MPTGNYLSRLLASLALASARHPKKVLAGAILLTLAGGYLASRLDIDTKLANLLPRDLPALQEYRQRVPELGKNSLMVAILEVPGQQLSPKHLFFFRKYRRQLKKIEAAHEGRLGMGEEILGGSSRHLRTHGLYLLKPPELDQLNKLLEPDRIKEQLAKYSRLSSIPLSPRFDPLELVPFLEQIFLPIQGITLDSFGNFFLTKDKKLAFFFLETSSSAGHTRSTETFLKEARRIEAELWNKTKENLKSIPERPQIYWTGLPVQLLEDKQILSRALLVNTLVSSLGVALLFLYFFRSFRSLLLAYVPMTMGILWSFGLAELTVGSLNVLTVGVGGILVGLGIDFPGYLLNRFYQRREQGMGLEQALQNTWGDSGRSACYGALTTCAAFSLMILARFKAFRELGLIVGSGLFLTLLAVLIVLPALLALWEKQARGEAIRRYPPCLIRIPTSRARGTIFVCLAVFLGFGIFLVNFRLLPPLQQAQQVLFNMNSPSLRAFEKFSHALNTSLFSFPLVVQGKDLEETLQWNDQLTDMLRRYQEEGKIAGYDSLSRLLPSKATQMRRQELIKNYPNLQPKQFHQNYTGALPERLFEGLSGHGKYRNALTEILSSKEMADPKELLNLASKGIWRNYLMEKNGLHLIQTYVYLPAGADYLKKKEAVMGELLQQDLFTSGKAGYHSEEKIITEVSRLMTQQVVGLVGGISLVIVALVWLYFRSLKLTFLALTPMVLGGVAALGSYTLWVGPFSVVNFLWFPIYIGLCIDDSLHIGSYLQAGGGNLKQALEETGGAVIFTSVSNIVGIGSLAWVNIPIVREAGIFVSLAMGWELIASLLVFPALCTLFIKKS